MLDAAISPGAIRARLKGADGSQTAMNTRAQNHPILRSMCEAEQEEVCGNEREQHTRRQLLIPIDVFKSTVKVNKVE